MGKFSSYVDSINHQTNLLRETLTDATGINCLSMNIGNCAQVVKQHISGLPEESGYIRPAWYPNIKEILANAPVIEKDAVAYYPCYIMLCNTNEDTQIFYRNYSTSSGAINYYGATGCDALLFSDDCDNDINNADSSKLVVGVEISHKWNYNKDITNPENDAQRVRWLIGYGTLDTYNGKLYNMRISNNSYCIELIFAPVKMFSNFLLSPIFSGGGTIHNAVMKYIDAGDIIGKTNPSSMCAGLVALEEMVLPEIDLTNSNKYDDTLKYCYSLRKLKAKSGEWSLQMGDSTLRAAAITHANISSEVTRFDSYCFSECPYLKSVSISAGVVQIGSYFCSNCRELEAIVIPDTVTIIGSSFCTGCISLKSVILSQNLETLGDGFLYNVPIERVDLPSSLKTISTSSTSNTFMNYTRYIGLWNDFDMTGKNFTSDYVIKSSQWFKDLCGWLKDKTGTTANTLKIGTLNINYAKTIWLTFNPNDKRDITWVDAGTEGAINVVQFITEQLNWTLS